MSFHVLPCVYILAFCVMQVSLTLWVTVTIYHVWERSGKTKDVYWLLCLWRSIKSCRWKQWKADDDREVMSLFVQWRSSLRSAHLFVSQKWQTVKSVWIWLMPCVVMRCAYVCVCEWWINDGCPKWQTALRVQDWSICFWLYRHVMMKKLWDGNDELRLPGQ